VIGKQSTGLQKTHAKIKHNKKKIFLLFSQKFDQLGRTPCTFWHKGEENRGEKNTKEPYPCQFYK